MERYPGPGQYCPECGELLRPVPAEPPPLPVARLRRGNVFFVAGAAVVFAAVAAVLGGGTRLVPAFGVRVCASTMTDRVANEIVRVFSAQRGGWPYHYTVTRPGTSACDVRFFTQPAGISELVFARDGVVAIVNPLNPIARLDVAQLRGVLSGRITNWSELGGRTGPIAVAVPDDDSDEAREVAARVMRGQPAGAHVNRSLAAAQIVRWVSSPSGAGAIGIVPFSIALPAKVLALGKAPAPSTLSIADDRYALSMGVMAGSDYRSPARPARALLTFVHSRDIDVLINRTALVSKNGR